jgi:ribosomal RNA-processing protein 12
VAATNGTPAQTAAGAEAVQRSAKKRKLLNLKEPGAEYRAKKAGGDVWKKGVPLQPHAYIPLDPRLLSKKHHDQAVQHFAVVVDSNKRNRQHQQAIKTAAQQSEGNSNGRAEGGAGRRKVKARRK